MTQLFSDSALLCLTPTRPMNTPIYPKLVCCSLLKHYQFQESSLLHMCSLPHTNSEGPCSLKLLLIPQLYFHVIPHTNPFCNCLELSQGAFWVSSQFTVPAMHMTSAYHKSESCSLWTVSVYLPSWETQFPQRQKVCLIHHCILQAQHSSWFVVNA